MTKLHQVSWSTMKLLDLWDSFLRSTSLWCETKYVCIYSKLFLQQRNTAPARGYQNLRIKFFIDYIFATASLKNLKVRPCWPEHIWQYVCDNGNVNPFWIWTDFSETILFRAEMFVVSCIYHFFLKCSITWMLTFENVFLLVFFFKLHIWYLYSCQF